MFKSSEGIRGLDGFWKGIPEPDTTGEKRMKMSIDRGSRDKVIERAPWSVQRNEVFERSMNDISSNFVQSLKLNFGSSFLEGRPAQGHHILFSVPMLKDMVPSNEPGSSLV